MAVSKYRVHEVAKDFDVPNKYVMETIAAMCPGEVKNHMTALEMNELNALFDHISSEHKVPSFEGYFKAGDEERRRRAEEAANTEEAKFEAAKKAAESARKKAVEEAALMKEEARRQAKEAIDAKRVAPDAPLAKVDVAPAAADVKASTDAPAKPEAPIQAAADVSALADTAAAPAKPAAASAEVPKTAEAPKPDTAARPAVPAQSAAAAPGAPRTPAGFRPNTNQRADGKPVSPPPPRPQYQPRPAQPQDGSRPPFQGQRPAPQGTGAPRPQFQQGGQRPAPQGQGTVQPRKPAPPQRSAGPQQTTRREGVRVVDTRSSNVDLSKFDERFAEMAPDRARNFGGGKQRFKKNQNQRPAPFQKRETEAEKLRRLALEKARRAPLNIVIPDEIVVSELATRLKKSNADVVKKLFLMGSMVSANDSVDYDTAALVAEEFGAIYAREVVVTIEERLIDVSSDSEEALEVRSPVVVVMGHVDHGKTSLLDAIRDTRVTAGEAGGITQHIGAYKVTFSGRDITFLDTPGHAAFTSMRARGANVTDIAILVIAADDGIMPQTVEAINHAKAANVAIIVAINKIDRPDANIERVKQELTEYNLVPEEWGGDIICTPVSAVTHEGIDNLLEMVLLTADMKELRANPARRGLGTVVEAWLDKGRGAVSTLLVQNGTLKTGDIIIAGTSVGRIRAMNDDMGRRITQAGPSTPVEIIGLAEVPQAGDLFYAVEDEKMARELAEQRRTEEKQSQQKTTKVSLDDLFNQIQEGNMKELALIVKADVQGSAEAVKASLEKLSGEEVKVRVIHSGVGAITGSDLMLAEASSAIVIGFNVRPDATIREDAADKGVDIRTYRIIYECIEEMEAALKGMLAPKLREVILGQAEVRATYKVSGVGTIAGCYVTNGKIVRSCKARVLRDSVVVSDTVVDSLKRFKDDAKEVAQNFECGIQLERFNDIKEGDVIEGYLIEEYRD